MKLRGKIICVLIFFGIVILIAFMYVIYPNISLGCEGDARLYHNHVLSQKTGIDYQTVFDNKDIKLYWFISRNHIRRKPDISH